MGDGSVGVKCIRINHNGGEFYVCLFLAFYLEESRPPSQSPEQVTWELIALFCSHCTYVYCYFYPQRDAEFCFSLNR